MRPLRRRFPAVEFEVTPVTTHGDRHKSASLERMKRGMFVHDIEKALVSGEIDLAVHSAKDVPSSIPDGLVVRAAGRRKDPRDVQVNRWGVPLMELPPAARMGTSSPRRTALLKSVRPDLEIIPIRGNVGTRLEKARGQDYDGVVLAAAGLLRLGRESEITEYLSPEICTPDVGQGTLAAEARSEDTGLIGMMSEVEHRPTVLTLEAERAFLTAIGGSCESPVAAYARLEGNQLHISAMAASPDGDRVVRVSADHDAGDPQAAGRRTAEALLEAGAKEVVTLG